ncbi:unnamed protein product [Hermetia illucens]|uniref:Acyltransferase n=1 Tax=Hermetia illucens TaxID=343691 RepID=A0A7R8UAH3_HERIL|nr:2-acylglycerol O-acyltransferase 1-like [Hermetia illucens]CAD7077174.1 unnamed protein product [Hermetia illucens]
MSLFNIEWAPLNVPLHRRLETLTAAIWIFWLLFGEFICVFIFCALVVKGNIYIRALLVIYCIHIYRDRKAGDTGGKGQGYRWMRESKFWVYFKNYFPVDLVKTVDLSPDRNYLFASFPHGILSTGAFANFATSASNWKELFPGIRSKLVTLNFHFQIPFFRIFPFSWGLASASSNSLKALLTASNDPKDPINRDGYTANAATVVVGGAQESLYCRPNNYQVVVKKRKGFIKMALVTGAPIVPVFSFGEVDVFDQPANPPGSLLRRYQEWFKSITGMAPIMFIGRGFFQYSFGMIPRRRRITTVIGAPLEVPHNTNPTWDEINEVHAKFIEALIDLFETHKHKYIQDAKNVKLIIE